MKDGDNEDFWFGSSEYARAAEEYKRWVGIQVTRNVDGSYSPVIQGENLKVDFDLRLTPYDKMFMKACGISLTKDTRCDSV